MSDLGDHDPSISSFQRKLESCVWRLVYEGCGRDTDGILIIEDRKLARRPVRLLEPKPEQLMEAVQADLAAQE